MGYKKSNINYLLSNAWHHQLKARNRAPVRYSFKEFSDWVLNNKKFRELYRLWLESLYDKTLTPTIIRINPNKDFYLENLTVTTSKKAKEIKVQKRGRKVIQLDMNGKELARYQNARVALTFVSMKSYSNIHQACKGLREYAGGYKWKYAE